jgi:hypothetical protein
MKEDRIVLNGGRGRGGYEGTKIAFVVMLVSQAASCV